MRKIFIISALLLSIIINAQKLNKDEYEKAVDYITCVCVNDSEFKSEPRDCNIKEIDAAIKNPQTRKLFVELQSLKKDDPSSKQFLQEDIFNDSVKYRVIYDFAQKRKGGKLSDIKTKIKGYLSNDLSEANIQLSDPIEVPAVTQTAQSQSISEKITSPKSSTYNSMLWDIILAVLIIILIFGIIAVAKWLGETNEKLRNIVKKNNMPVSTSHFSEAKLDRLQTEINELRKTIYDLKERPASSVAQPDIVPHVVELRVPPPQTADEVFYMATPSDEKQFDNSGRAESFKPTQSLYKFAVDSKNRNLAKFVFQSDASGIRESVNNPQLYIERVCDPQNALNQNAQNIITVHPGVAEKRNDKWIVTIKAQIRYQ